MTPEVAVLIGAVLGSILSWLFARSKTRAEIETMKTEAEKNRTEAEKNRAEAEKLRQEAEQLRKESHVTNETAKELTEEARQVISYRDYKAAFAEMNALIRNYIKEQQNNGVPNPVVKLELLAVAMTFSWENFIVTDMLEILNDFKEATIDLAVLFLDPDYLKEQDIAKTPIDWVAVSEKRIHDVKNFLRQCDYYRGRLVFKAKTYRNLPHWHGWLVNDNQLFLGRADWVDVDEMPILRVGQNKYRHFNNTYTEGSERITLFNSWRDYYFNFASEWVCDSTNSNNQLKSS